MKLPFSSPVAFDTTLPQVEVVRRLRQKVESPFTFSFLMFGGAIIGRVHCDYCWLRYRTWYNNGFQRRLTLTFQSTPEGTRLTGYFAPHPAALVFSAFWCCGMIFFALAGIVAVIEGSKDWEIVAIPLGIILFFIAMFSFGIRLSSLSEPDVMEFVKELILEDAHQGNGHPSVESGLLIRPRHEVPDRSIDRK